MVVIRKPASVWSSVQTASVSSFVGGWPSCASALASAIEKHVACAAAISSSGLVLPPGCSKREANVTSWPVIAPLSRSNVPDPPRRSPTQVAWAFRSIAIPVLLVVWWLFEASERAASMDANAAGRCPKRFSLRCVLRCDVQPDDVASVRKRDAHWSRVERAEDRPLQVVPLTGATLLQ